MTFKINGTDYSGILTKYDWTETPRQISGKNGGTALDGSAIYDIIATKYDFSHTCRPMTAASYKALCTLMELNPVTVEYTSAAKNTIRTVTAQLTVSGASLVMVTTDRTLYNGITLSFKEK